MSLRLLFTIQQQWLSWSAGSFRVSEKAVLFECCLGMNLAEVCTRISHVRIAQAYPYLACYRGSSMRLVQ